MKFDLDQLIATKTACDKDYGLLEVNVLTTKANHKLGNIICLIKRPYYDNTSLVFIDNDGKVIWQIIDQPKTTTQIYTSNDYE